MSWMDLVTLAEAAAVFYIAIMEHRNYGLAKESLQYTRNFLDARAAWYNVRRAKLELERAITAAQARAAETPDAPNQEDSPTALAIADAEGELLWRPVPPAPDSKR